MKKVIIGLAGLMAVALSACGKDSPTPSGATIGATDNTIQEPRQPAFDRFDIGRLDSELSKPVTQGRLLNIAYHLSKDGQVEASGFHGVRTLAGSDPVTQDTIYRIYSMTKPVTAVAVLMLYEDGKIDLDAPVSQYLPELGSLKVFTGKDAAGKPGLAPVSHAPTVRELLSHTAGFGYGLTTDDYVNQRYRKKNVERAPNFDALLKRVGSIPLRYQPGEGWEYSIASDIQGALIERVSGMTFEAFLETRIFQPLDMPSTGFSIDESDIGRLADITRQAAEPNTLALAEPRDQRLRGHETKFPSGGAGLVSTLKDYDRFAHMLLGRGTLDGVTLLKPETIDLMFGDLATAAIKTGGGQFSGPGRGRGYALGIGAVTEPTMRRNGPPVGTVFWSGAAGTWFWIDPANDIVFIAMIQSVPPVTNLQTLSNDIVYHALLSDFADLP
tara:strand:+ start:902 stop:2227 length:1326 start_codon:yes stop_codon:yes gene_type:complete